MSVAVPVVDTFDGLNRRINLKQGVTSFHLVTDIYTEYRNERRLNESFRKYDPLVEAKGYESKGVGKFTSRFLKLLTDATPLTTKIVPYDEAGEITALGEAITDVADTDPSIFDISGITNPVIINYTPPDTELVELELTQQQIDDIIDGINNPVIIDPLEKFNLIEANLKTKYIDEAFNWKIKLNQTYIDVLIIETDISPLIYLPTSKTLLEIVLDASLIDFDFNIYAES